MVFVFMNDMRGNLTGTMGITIFLCVLEVLLGTLCISIPMLRPFYTRYKAQKSSSKLSESASGQKKSLRTFGQISSKPKSKDPFATTTEIYAESTHQGQWELRSLEDGSSSNSNGSGRELTAQKRSVTSQIAVETNWSVSRE
jgi:hypothetical protein